MRLRKILLCLLCCGVGIVATGCSSEQSMNTKADYEKRCQELSQEMLKLGEKKNMTEEEGIDFFVKFFAVHKEALQKKIITEAEYKLVVDMVKPIVDMMKKEMKNPETMKKLEEAQKLP